MKIGRFSITFFLLLVALSTKVVFFVQEPQYLHSVVGVLEIIVLVVCCAAGLYSFFSERDIKQAKSKKQYSLPLLALFSTCIVALLLFSFYLNFIKKAPDWDDVALYDARAKFLLQGVRLSDMPKLSKYDFKNGYYYLLYPPFTSELHFIWYSLHIPLQIHTLYSFMLFFLVLSIFAITQPRIGTIWSVILTFLVASQENLFSVSLVAYTNLPYTLYLSLGILLLWSYFISKKNWEFWFGVLFVALSQWIRFLEPIWVAIVCGFFLAQLTTYRDIKKTLRLSIPFLLVCIVEYGAWRYFENVVGRNQTIFHMTLQNYVEPVIGIFTGSLITMFLFFIHAWGTPLFIHFSSLWTTLSNRDKSRKASAVFLKLTLLFSVGIYFAGLYFLSFQASWWTELGGSLVRSSTFLLPCSLCLLVQNIKDFLKK